MLGPSAIVSAVKWAAVVGVVTLALVIYQQNQKDARNMRDSLITVNAEKISQQARAQELENANVVLESALQISLESHAASAKAVEELNEQFAEARIESTEQQAVFDDHDLQNLANHRPETIERLSNRATKERFDELEDLFNSE